MKVYDFLTDEGDCSYLDNHTQKIHYKVIQDCSKEFYSKLIERGWRRFGKMFSRPICKNCNKCESMKIDIENFNPSKSMRRTIKKNSDLKIVIRKASITQDHLNLFNKYHKFMENKKGWKFEENSSENYFGSFVSGYNEFGYEMLFFLDNKLIAVDLIDILDDGISAVYFYYDPDFSKRYLGVYSIYKEIELAQELNLNWIYLGYYVQECGSLNYKAKYTPHKILEGRPDIDEEFIWS